MLKKLCERIYAVQNAKKLHEQKMEKVYQTDELMMREWKQPVEPLTDEQLRQVEEFWSKYSFAYRNDPRVQAHYTAVSGRFDPRYCGFGLNTYYLYRFYDDPSYHTAFHDKNYREFLFRDFPCTPAVVHRVCGSYYDEKFRPISYHSAMSALTKLAETEEKLIVKPTPGGKGEGIRFIRKGDGAEQIALLMDGFEKDDLVVERIVTAHPSYAAPNPQSLNTLRIITFLYENEFSVIATLFRMGVNGSEVDNLSQGGLACGVNADGSCMEFAFDRAGNRYERHPGGLAFKGHVLAGVDKAHDMVASLHRRVPQFKQLSWDIAVDERGEPVLVEMNPRGDNDLYQSIGCLAFGEKTEQVLDEQLITLFWKPGANRNWDYREYSDHVVLAKCAQNRKTVTVPERINGKFVTHIASGCFTGEKIKEIVIPGCVRTIEDGICADGINAHVTYLPNSGELAPPPVVELHGKLKLGRNFLWWEPVEGATHYYVYRMQQNGNRRLLRAVSAAVTSFEDHNVIDGTVYHYYVRSYNSRGNLYGGWSRPVALKTGIELPVPTELRVEVRSGQNDLSWTPASGATHYHVYRRRQDGEWKLLKTVPGCDRSFSDCKVENNVTYGYCLRSYNGKHGVMSAPCEAVVVKGRIELTAPAVCGKVAAGENRLIWEPVKGATHYYIYRMKQGSSREFLKSVPAGTTRLSDRDVEPGTVYYYYVRSRDVKRDVMSDWSEAVAIRAVGGSD